MKNLSSLNNSYSKLLFLILPCAVAVYAIFLSIEHKILYDNLLYSANAGYQEELISGKVLFIKENKWQKIFLIKTHRSKYYVQTEPGNDETDDLSYGDKVTLSVLSKPVNLENKYEKFLLNSYDIRKIAYLLSVKECYKNKSYLYKVLDYIYFTTNKIRNFLVKTVNEKLTPPLNVLLLRLTLGYDDGELKDVKNYFQDAGVAHVLVVSGLHVGFVYILVYFLLKFTFINSVVRHGLACVVVILYMFITGCSPPVVRATVIVISIALAAMLQQNYNSIHSLLLAGFLIFLFSPRSLFSPSFQLSFVACFGIVYFYPYFYRPLKEFIEKTNMVVQYITKLFITTLSAQIMVAPLIMYYFNKFSVVSFLSNIFVIPLTCVMLWLGIISYLFELVLPSFSSVIYVLIRIVGMVFITTVEFFANLPYAKFEVSTPDVYKILVYYVVIILTSKLTKPKNFLLSLLFGFLFLSVNLNFGTKNLKITFFDVGIGESVLINVKDKEFILVDTGADENVAKYNLLPYFYKDNIEKIDYLVITHGHYPHYGAARYILHNFKIKNLYTSNFFPQWTNDYRSIINLANEKNVNYKIVHTTVNLKIDDVYISIIPNFVITGFDEIKLTDKNSVLVLVEYKNHVVVLPNDLPAEYVIEKLSCFNLENKFLIVQLPRHGKYVEDIVLFEEYLRRKNTRVLFYLTTGRNTPLLVRLKSSNFITGIVGNIELSFRKLQGKIYKIEKNHEGIVIQL